MGGSDPCDGCGHYYLHAPRCPTSDEGTSHCALAETTPATPAEKAVIDAAVAETEHEQAHGESSPRLRNARVLAVARLWNADHPVDDPARLRSERNKT